MWPNARLEHNGMIQAPGRPGLLVCACKPRTDVVASSTDSDLEAISHNPTDGSFARVAFQPRANTNYPNQRFLSY